MEELILNTVFIALFTGWSDDEDDFWDPVKVGLSSVEQYTLDSDECECPICMDTKQHSKKLLCCKNNMCVQCVETWFKESVKCPFCFRDLRDLDVT
jgi:hypothetical protein